MIDDPVTAPITCYVISMGDPFNGIELFGTFPNKQSAIDYGNDHMISEWWVVPVYSHMAGDE